MTHWQAQEIIAIRLGGEAQCHRADFLWTQAGGDAGDGAAGEGGEEEEATAWPDALVDALLALLSKRTAPLPSAPLRDAVEAAFRAMADSVTATGEAPPCSAAERI